MRVGVAEAKAHLTTLLDKVIAGDVVTISKRGLVIAWLIPPQDDRSAAEFKRPANDPPRPAGETSPAPAPVATPKPPAPASAPGLTLAQIIAAGR